MAVTTEDLLVNIKVNTENADKSLSDLVVQLKGLTSELKATKESSQKSSDGINGTGAAMLKLNATLEVAKKAYEFLIVPIKDSIKEFQNSEDAQTRLRNTLELTSGDVENSFSKFKSLADELQNTTTVSDDAAIKLITLAKAMGQSDAMAEKMIRTAAGLSAVTGKDLDASFQDLVATLKGATRGVAGLAPEILGLTDAENRAGKGIELLGAKFDKFAGQELKTFGGLVKAEANAMSDVFEEVGGILDDVFDFKKKTANTTEVLRGLKAELVSFRAEAKQLDLAKIFLEIGKSANIAADNIENIDLKKVKASLGFGDLKTMDVIAKSIKQVKLIDPQAIDDARKALETIKKITLDMQGKAAEFGANETDLIKIRTDLKLKELGVEENKVKLAGLLNAENLKSIAAAKEAINTSGIKELATAQKKNLDEVIAKNKELGVLVKQDSMTKQDLIDAETALMIEQIRVKQEQSAYDAAGNAAIESQIDLLKEKASLEKSKAPSREFQGAEKVGKNIAESISGVMTKGSASIVGGMVSGASAILDAVDGLLDLIPNILNKISGIFDKATALPDAILNAVKGLGRAVTDFVKNFIPNLLRAIPEIIDSLGTALAEGIPNAFISLLDNLPDIIGKFLDRLPEIAEKLVTALIPLTPKLSLAIMEFMIKDAPQIGIEIAKTMLIHIPKAIVKGVIEGAKTMIKMIGDFFKNGGGLLNVDLDGVKQIASDVGRILSGASSKLFAVTDVTTSAKAASAAVAISDAGKKAGTDIKDALANAMAEFSKNWNGMMIKLNETWTAIKRDYWDPFAEKVSETFLAVKRDHWDPFSDKMISVWLDVKEKYWQPFMDKIDETWSAVKSKYWDSFYKDLISGGQTIGAALTKGFEDLFNGIGKIIFGFIEGLQNASGGLSNTMTKLGEIPGKFGSVISDIRESLMSFKFSSALEGFAWPKIDSALQGFAWPKIDSALAGFSWPDLPKLNLDVNLKMPDGTSAEDTKSFIKKALGFAQGGLVPMYANEGTFVPRGTDTVPAMLTPGEFVLNRGAVSSLGQANIQKLNNGQMPQGPSSTDVSVNLNITTTSPIDESYIRQKLMPRIKEEFRRSSLDGSFLISKSGIRS